MAGDAADLIGVAVSPGTGTFLFLRFRLRGSHLDRLNNPDRLTIRGQAANGFILAPDNAGKKLSRAGFSDGGGYLQETLSHFELSSAVRKRVDVRPIFENSHIRIPPLPHEWIAGTADFAPAIEETRRAMHLPRNPADDPMRLGSDSGPLNGHAMTVPPSKPVPAYTVPVDGPIRDLQARLAVKLDEARAMIREIESRTNMQFTLDRNLRLVVKLPPTL